MNDHSLPPCPMGSLVHSRIKFPLLGFRRQPSGANLLGNAGYVESDIPWKQLSGYLAYTYV